MVEMGVRWILYVHTTTKFLALKELSGGGGDGGDVFP